MERARAEIKSAVIMLVGDNTLDPTYQLMLSGNNYFTDSAYNRFVMDAWREIASRLTFAQVEETIAVVASQASYNCQLVSQIELIDYDDKVLEFITAERLTRLDEEWETRTGEPLYAIVGGFKNEWGIIDNAGADDQFRKFTLYPAPTAAVNIRVIGKTLHLDLDNDFRVPAIPGWCCEAVVCEAAARVLESGVPERNVELAAAYRAIRDWYIDVAMRRLNQRVPAMLRAKGGMTRAPRTLYRDTSVNATGRAGAGD